MPGLYSFAVLEEPNVNMMIPLHKIHVHFTRYMSLLFIFKMQCRKSSKIGHAKNEVYGQSNIQEGSMTDII